jgi:hypothetical protein
MKLLNKGASIVISVLDWSVNVRSFSTVISEISTIAIFSVNHQWFTAVEEDTEIFREAKNFISDPTSKNGRDGIRSAHRSQEVVKMTCPGCNNENEMAYSALSHGFVCLEANCGFELEMDAAEAMQVLEFEEELVCC